MSNRNSCVDCKFFSSVAPSSPYEGECRKNAPTLVDELGMAVFPRTEDGDWCGDFLRLPELYDVDDDCEDEQEYDVDLPDYDEDSHLYDDADEDDEDDQPDDGRFDEGADYHNLYKNWPNKDSAIDNLVQDFNDIGDDVLDLRDRLAALEKQVQILRQPKERIGW